MSKFSKMAREANELRVEAIRHISRLGIPGSVELWELRNHWTRVKLMCEQQMRDCIVIEEAYR